MKCPSSSWGCPVLTTSELQRSLDLLPLIRGWANEIEAEAIRRLQRGETLPGYTLGTGRKHRVWTDTKKAEALLLLRFPREVVLPEGLISPSQAEKLTKRKGIWMMLELLTQTPEGGPKLWKSQNG